MNTLEILHLEAIENNIEGTHNELIAAKSAEITERIAVEFHHWMRENDTAENAELYCNFSDEDMFNEFLKTRL